MCNNPKYFTYPNRLIVEAKGKNHFTGTNFVKLEK